MGLVPLLELHFCGRALLSPLNAARRVYFSLLRPTVETLVWNVVEIGRPAAPQGSEPLIAVAPTTPEISADSLETRGENRLPLPMFG